MGLWRHIVMERGEDIITWCHNSIFWFKLTLNLILLRSSSYDHFCAKKWGNWFCLTDNWLINFILLVNGIILGKLCEIQILYNSRESTSKIVCGTMCDCNGRWWFIYQILTSNQCQLSEDFWNFDWRNNRLGRNLYGRMWYYSVWITVWKWQKSYCYAFTICWKLCVGNRLWAKPVATFRPLPLAIFWSHGRVFRKKFSSVYAVKGVWSLLTVLF